MKPVRAILINPVAQTVTEISISGDADSIREQLGCDSGELSLADCLDNGDAIYADGAGLLKSRIGFFTKFPLWLCPVAGNLLIAREENGEPVDCNSTRIFIINQIFFMGALLCNQFLPFEEEELDPSLN